MARVLVVGGGTGGIAAANELRRLLPSKHKVTLIEKSPTYHVGATKPWVMLGEKTPEEISRSMDRIKRRRVELLRGVVQRIDPAAATVATDKGEVKGDYMIIALGADYDMAAVPGLKESAETFYTLDGAVRLRDRLNAFAGGDLVILIPRAPFKCPPAPYEAAMLLHSHFKKKGMLGKVKIQIVTLEGAPMATGGPAIGQAVRGMLQERDIGYQPSKRTQSVDPARKLITFEDKSQARFDLLITVPPHSAPEAVKKSGLTNQSGWIPSDPKTLQMLGGSDSGKVYVIGDVSVVSLPGRFKPENPLVLPKAGTIADSEARVAAAQIAARINGKSSDSAFEGKGFCYIETGDRHAMRGDGTFYDLPNPVMKHAAPDMMQYEDKIKWVNDWLERNLG
jgi:sulfide:quinone oxidoreductase